MSRDFFSNNKEKRTRTSSGGSNNSFVKNVTSRVSGLLPATITKWFSSPSSNSNGSAPAADGTDSSTEDEAPESPAIAQPPAKRMRFSPGASYGTEGNCVTNSMETIEETTMSVSYTVQSPPGRTTFRRGTNFVSTPIRSPEGRDEMGTGTVFPQHTISTKGPCVTRKLKSLFGNQSEEISDASKTACVKTSNNTVRDPKQPSLKPTLLGSPFYAGRTTYGGAASSYINQPNITQRHSTTVIESTSNTDNTMSHSARRVMELLESYSSPLTEAKRIPQFTRPTRQELMKRFSESLVKSPYSKPNSYKTQELHLPSVASVLRLKQRSRLNDTTNAARQIIASHSSSSPDYFSYSSGSKSDQTETDGSSKLTTKVKSRLTRPNRGDSNTLDTDTIAPPELPNAVLQIDPNNLPNFSTPLTSKPATSIETTVIKFEPKSAQPIESISKPETISSNHVYNFVNPVTITSESPKTTTTPPKFTFGSPERSIDKKLASEDESCKPPSLLGTKQKENKADTALATWSCPDCWVSNKSDADKCVCCGYKNAPKPASKAKCCLCKLADSQADKDRCVNCEKVQTNHVSKPLKADTSKWKCKDCWVDNEEATEKCVCCGASNPKGSSQPAPAKKPEASAAGMCPKCFSLTTFGKCGKCAELTSKPANALNNVLKSQSNKWECQNCLVRNDSDKNKCVCCEVERSGKLKESEKKQFNFGTVNTTFKFGIDPKVQEASAAKVVEKPAETNVKAEESETNNNVLAKAPTFSFGIPAKKSEDQADAPKSVAEETPKATFTFSLPKQNLLAPTPAPMFGIPKTSTDASKDKVESKDKTEETKKLEQAPKLPVVTFEATTTQSTSNSTVSQPSMITSFAVEKKDAPSDPVSLPSTSVEAAPTLTFSAPKPSTGLIAITTAAATPATSISFAPITTPALFQKTDTPKTISLFQNSDLSTTATVSLFQKSEAPAAAPPAATAPLFSFGGAQTAQPQAEKPKFTFGNNIKIDVFKPTTFGASDNNASMSKFSLGSAAKENSLANPLTTSGNTLTGNSLSTGNGLAVNALGASTALTPGAGGMFGAPVQKENMWSPMSNNAVNPFVTNATSNSTPKPFAFGSSTPFNSNPPAFGASNTQPSSTFGSAAQPTTAFGGASQTAPPPAFGSNVQSPPNMFGMPNNSQFSSNMFGSAQTPAAGSMPPPAAPMFCRSSAGTPAFGSPNAPAPFETPSHTPAQPPAAFNFNTPQPTNIFGFRQQQQPQQQGLGGGQAGVYSFGAAGAPPQSQVQFNMGSAQQQFTNPSVRRIRKAARRSSQR